MPFRSLGLHDVLLTAIAEAGYAQPTPIQQAVIPLALEGADIIGCAQTGTGKTAAFALPILQRLIGSARTFEFRSLPRPKPGQRLRERQGGTGGLPQVKDPFTGARALVLAPTRELALQVEEQFRLLGARTDARTLIVYGGVGFHPQFAGLHAGVDVIVATPGRLLDLMDRRAVAFDQLQVLVLDEADRMLDMGFIEDIRRIVRKVPASRQTMLFSATMPPEIEQLAREVLRDPQTVQIGRRSAPAVGVTHYMYPVAPQRKEELLVGMLHEAKPEDAMLIFTRTKVGCDRVASALAREGFTIGRLHSNRSQSQRESALAAFRAGRVQILVATDVAARGLDIEGIAYVVNYDVPTFVEDYVHRIGRTARAAATGTAITFVTPLDELYARSIEKFIGVPIQRIALEGFAAQAGDSFRRESPRPRRRSHSGRR